MDRWPSLGGEQDPYPWATWTKHAIMFVVAVVLTAWTILAIFILLGFANGTAKWLLKDMPEMTHESR